MSCVSLYARYYITLLALLSFAMAPTPAPAPAPARADRTKPDRTGTMSCTVRCVCVTFGSPVQTDEATKWSCCPLSLLSLPPCAIVRSKHCFQCRLEAAPVDAHRSPAPSPPSCRRRPTTGRHCCCCKFNRFGTRCVVV